jgi:tetratricopeptide (TPR) repeat protein
MLKSSPTLRSTLLAALCAGLLAASAGAQEQKREYSVSDETSELLSTKYKAAVDAKDLDGALRLIQAQFDKLKDKSSFEAALLLQIKAQTLLQKAEFTKAIEPLEQMLTLSDSHTPTYFEDRAITESVYFLSQLYFQEAANSKVPAQSIKFYDKAEAFMERWTKLSKKPTADNYLYYTQLLYNRAILDPEKPDLERIKRALEYVDKAMLMTVRPKDNLFLLKLVCLQQLGRNKETAEYFELLVKQKPENKTYWQQLAAIYLNQQQDIRAIVTIERAQGYGHMNSPADNFNLVGIHFNLGQFERAAELLEKGLKDGSITNEQKNWELLAFSYQQMNRDFKAIDALQRAAKVFPESGQLEYLIAQNYYSMEKLDDALKHLQLCAAKGGGNKPHQSLLFMAYIAFELKKYDVALDAANKAIAMPEGKKEGERMKAAIDDAIAAREAKLKNS